MHNKTFFTSAESNCFTVKYKNSSTMFKPAAPQDGLSIICAFNGCANIIKDGEKFRLNSSEYAVICPRSICVFTDCENFEYYEISVDFQKSSGEIARFAHFFNNETGVPFILNDKNSFITEIIKNVTAIDCTNAENLLCTALQFIYDNRDTSAQNDVKRDKQRYAVERILNYIYDAEKTVSVEKAAEISGYSDFYTMKLFKQYIGDSIVEYANKYKIHKAAVALLTAKKTVREIAAENGFDNISYFNRQFRKMYGLTPKEYRAKTQI